MSRTFIRQSDQIAKSDVYDDSIAPTEADYETNTVDIQQDLNNIRSQIQNILNREGSAFPTGNWWGDITAPSTFENGKKRGVIELNKDLHALERFRVMTSYSRITDIRVPTGERVVVLDNDTTRPRPNPSGIGYAVAVGDTTNTGSIAAQATTFGTAGLDVVLGATVISPKNLVTIVTGSSRDPLLSSDRVIYGLLQSEVGTPSHVSNNTDQKLQITFVRVNENGDALELCPAADIGGKDINYITPVRKALLQLNEQDFLRGAEVDVPSTSASSRKNAYDNQGITPVSLTNNAALDLGTGFYWEIGDEQSRSLFKVLEGSAGDTSDVTISEFVQTFTVDSDVNNFKQGVTVDAGDVDIQLGVTAGVIETLSTNDLRLRGAGELLLDDGNQPGTWAATNGIKLSDTGTEWEVFEEAFGEVSLLKAAYQSRRRDKVYAEVLGTISANTNVSGTRAGYTGANLKNSVMLPYMNSGSFVKDYDVYLNGQLLNPGATSGTDNDYYPGIDEFSLKFEFTLKDGDVICVVPYVRD